MSAIRYAVGGALFSMKLDYSRVTTSTRVLKRKLNGDTIGRAVVTAVEATIIPEARRILRSNDSIFLGHLHSSLRAKAVAKTSFGIGSHTKVQIGSFGVFWGKNIEDGVPAGTFIPVNDKLIQWVKRKVIDREYVFPKGIKKQERYKIVQPEPIARAIAFSIHKHGSRARPFLLPAWNNVKDRFFDDFRSRARKGLGLS